MNSLKVFGAEYYMQRALSLAEQSSMDGKGGPFGAVIVLGDEIIGEGSNLVTSTFDPTAHAEMVAIRRACEKLKDFKLNGATIYSSCEPCPMCLSAIYWARISAIYFGATRKQAMLVGFDDDFLYSEVNKPLYERKIPINNILSDESYHLMQTWQAQATKVMY